MRRLLVFRKEASADVAAAVDWYEDRSTGVGQEFLLELDARIQQIRELPFSAPEVYPQVRRARLFRFPYGVFFQIEPERIVVLAVLHAAREPRAL